MTTTKESSIIKILQKSSAQELRDYYVSRYYANWGVFDKLLHALPETKGKSILIDEIMSDLKTFAGDEVAKDIENYFLGETELCK